MILLAIGFLFYFDCLFESTEKSFTFDHIGKKTTVQMTRYIYDWNSSCFSLRKINNFIQLNRGEENIVHEKRK